MITDKGAQLQEKIPERMSRLTLFAFNHVGHLLARRANRELTRSGFTLQLEQVSSLFIVYFAGDELLSQQEIANLLQKDKSGIQRSIRTMERDGYLRIVSDELDRRKNLVQLTPAGKLVVEKVVQTTEAIDLQVTNRLSTEELAAFTTTLQKIKNILEA